MQQIYGSFQFPSKLIDQLTLYPQEELIEYLHQLKLGYEKKVLRPNAVKGWVMKKLDFSQLNFIYFDLLNRCGSWESFLQEIN